MGSCASRGVRMPLAGLPVLIEAKLENLLDSASSHHQVHLLRQEKRA